MINCTAKKLALALSLFLCIGSTKAQLIVSQTKYTVNQLVQNILLGNGVVASNITYTGAANAIGFFDGITNSTILGLDSGVIMCTGDIANAVGPNNIGSKSTDNNLGGDVDLDALTVNTTYDAAVLEFDFVPYSDTVKFRFIFASEEYPEFVNSGVNDGFGFFISGPGISGSYQNNAKNIALVPGTTTEITIDSLNANVHSAYYIDNLGGSDIQYDAFTKAITAISAVQCGKTYHIKIVIADAGDGVWDSGVFLESGSFISNGNVNVSTKISYSGNDSVMFEGCGQACLTFVRDQTNITKQDTLFMNIGGTATNTTDYNTFPTMIIFPPNVDSVIFCFSAVADFVSEGIETIILSFTPKGCSNGSVSIRLYISDIAKVVANAGTDQFICPGSSTNMGATATGGHGTYSYSWSNGGSTQNINANPTATTIYVVTVSDTCGNSGVDSITVFVNTAVPQVTSAGTIKICPGASTNISSTASNGTPAYTYSWSSGAGTTSTVSVSPTVTTTYTITVTDKCGKTATSAVTVYVPNPAPLNTNSPDLSICPGDNAALAALTSGGIGGYTFTWTVVTGTNTLSNTTSSTATINNAISGMNSFKVTVTDSCGNQVTKTVNVEVKPGCDTEIPNVFSPDGDGTNQYFAIKGIDNFDGSKLSIYDRWGLKLYESGNYKNDWDGDGIPEGTYYYVFYRSDGENYHGFFMLLRGPK